MPELRPPTYKEVLQRQKSKGMLRTCRECLDVRSSQCYRCGNEYCWTHNREHATECLRAHPPKQYPKGLPDNKSRRLREQLGIPNRTAVEAALPFLAQFDGEDAHPEIESTVQRFTDYFGSYPMHLIQPGEIWDYTESSRGDHKDPNIKHRYEVLKAFLGHAYSLGATDINLADHVPRPPREKKSRAKTKAEMLEDLGGATVVKPLLEEIKMMRDHIHEQAIRTGDPAVITQLADLTNQVYRLEDILQINKKDRMSDFISESGRLALEAELETLGREREETLGEVTRARADGDTSENSPLDAAQEELSFIEGRIQQIEHALRVATVIDASEADTVLPGTTIELDPLVGTDYERRRFPISSPYDYSYARGDVPSDSPLGAAVIGRRLGEPIAYLTPRGEGKVYRIGGIEMTQDVQSDSEDGRWGVSVTDHRPILERGSTVRLSREGSRDIVIEDPISYNPHLESRQDGMPYRQGEIIVLYGHTPSAGRWTLAEIY